MVKQWLEGFLPSLEMTNGELDMTNGRFVRQISDPNDKRLVKNSGNLKESVLIRELYLYSLCPLYRRVNR
jgi:hypothetical protein